MTSTIHYDESILEKLNEYEKKQKIKKLDVEEMGLDEGDHYQSMIFNENLKELD